MGGGAEGVVRVTHFALATNLPIGSALNQRQRGRGSTGLEVSLPLPRFLFFIFYHRSILAFFTPNSLVFPSGYHYYGNDYDYDYD